MAHAGGAGRGRGPVNPAERIDLTQSLLATVRIASLSTLGPDGPFCSMAPFAFDAEKPAFYLHLSRMARHTRNVEADPRVSMLVCDTDGADKNPLALARITCTGTAVPVPDDSSAKKHYLSRFPEASPIFSLPDFCLYAIVPNALRLVAGFGKAYDISPADLAD